MLRTLSDILNIDFALSIQGVIYLSLSFSIKFIFFFQLFGLILENFRTCGKNKELTYQFSFQIGNQNQSRWVPQVMIEPWELLDSLWSHVKTLQILENRIMNKETKVPSASIIQSIK